MHKLSDLFTDVRSVFVCRFDFTIRRVSVDCVGNSEILVVPQTKGLKIRVVFVMSVCPSVTTLESRNELS